MLSTALVCAALGTPAARAQEVAAPAAPCKTESCRIAIDWGSAGEPVQVDRRYGALNEYLQRVMDALAASGHKFVVGGTSQGIELRLRPRIVRAMCDMVPGTSTDMSCQMIGETEVEVLNADPALKLPGVIRVRNRCGSDQFMDIKKYSEYSAAMITYEFSREAKKKRPASTC
jgi:hypothetical protein